MSKGLYSAERNYAINDKELLSAIHGLKEWQHILEGTKHMIEILNDHRNLTYFWMFQDLNHPASMLVPLAGKVQFLSSPQAWVALHET